ncbi:hypothetical protein B0H16DRAFT_1739334 [Mycena metata]|uniref:Uncharacterized protein n=1 Tax=Mycena metata TaxID=1033252 RepID=A0AAD7HGA1_9AGAR|nr:hypothetical protein B0H16DRAFT_1739334 [Mycena metata]
MAYMWSCTSSDHARSVSYQYAKPLVRSITCWTLGRYVNWMTQSISEEHRNQYFVPRGCLLRMVLNNNKRVQEAGCSAFATLEEDAGIGLALYTQDVNIFKLQHLLYYIVEAMQFSFVSCRPDA